MPISWLNELLQARIGVNAPRRLSRLGRLGVWAGTLATAAFASLGPASAVAQQVALTPIGGQAFATPYYVTSAPGDPDRIFVVEAEGTIRLVEDGATRPTPFLSIPADVRDNTEGCSECGMFSIAFAPDYATSGLFYAFYTQDDPTPGNEHFLRIEEFRRSATNPDVADLASRRLVLEIEHFTAYNHNGGQLQFGPDGLLYIATGDGGDTPFEAQSLTSILGKLLRIDPRGAVPYSIPAGNPLADGPGGNADEIYAYGLRNPYRFSFDRATGDLTIGDVGGGAWEEADFKSAGTGAGANFGWPCFEGAHEHLTVGACSPPPTDHSPPALEYANPPSAPAAISGGYVIRDPALPAHAGRYLYADTYGAVPGLRTALLSDSGSSGDASLGVGVPNPVSFGEDACGRLYVVAFGGTVSRLDPASGPRPDLCANGAPVAGTSQLSPALGVALSARPSRAARRRGALVIEVGCDRACDLFAAGRVRIKRSGAGRRARVSGPLERASRRKRGRRGFTIRAAGARVSLQPGSTARLRLRFNKHQRRKLVGALKSRRRALAFVEVSASAGGSPVVASKRVRVKRKR